MNNFMCEFSWNIFTVPYACWTIINGLEVFVLITMAYGAFYWWATK